MMCGTGSVPERRGEYESRDARQSCRLDETARQSCGVPRRRAWLDAVCGRCGRFQVLGGPGGEMSSLRSVAIALVLACWAPILAAQSSYPTRPIHMIVPLAAGSAGDNAMRI